MLVFSQKKADREIQDRLHRHLSQLQATQAGSGRAAMQYLAGQLKAMGIPGAAAEGDYIQVVVHQGAPRYRPGTTLQINGKSLLAGKDFVPLAWSGQGSAKGEPLVAVQERRQPWVVDVDASLTDGAANNLFSDSALYQLAEKAQADEATAVLLYSSSAQRGLPAFKMPAAFPSLSIPVLFVDQAPARQFFADQTASVSIETQVAFSLEKDTTYRLEALVDHHAATTLVLAAGDPGSQAALLELAPLLSQGKSFAGQNYRLVAFNHGEDSSRSAFPQPVKAVFFLEGLSHMDATEPVLTVEGIPSVAKWSEAFDKPRHKTLVVRKQATSHASTTTAQSPLVRLRGPADGPDNLPAETNAIRYITDVIHELNR